MKEINWRNWDRSTWILVIAARNNLEKQTHEMSEGRREHRTLGGAERRPERAWC